MIEPAHAIAREDLRLPFCPRRICAIEDDSREFPKRSLEGEFCLNTKRVHPEAYALSLVCWGIIGTLTWGSLARRMDTPEAAQGRNSDFNLLMTMTAPRLRKRRKDLVVVWSEEFHASGEVHRHFLIGRDGLAHVDAAEVASYMTQLWTTGLHPFDDLEAKGIGTAVIEHYDYAKFGLLGVDYVAKRQQEFGLPDKAFGFSPAVLKAVEARQREPEDRHARVMVA